MNFFFKNISLTIINQAKTLDDLEKANRALDAYYKKKAEKLKLIEIKPVTSEKKRKTPSTKESIESKDGNVNRTLKKLKIDSDKESFITGKDPASDSEMPNDKQILEEPKEEVKEAEIEKSKQKKPSN